MRQSKFTDKQILAIVKEGESRSGRDGPVSYARDRGVDIDGPLDLRFFRDKTVHSTRLTVAELSQNPFCRLAWSYRASESRCPKLLKTLKASVLDITLGTEGSSPKADASGRSRRDDAQRGRHKRLRAPATSTTRKTGVRKNRIGL